MIVQPCKCLSACGAVSNAFLLVVEVSYVVSSECKTDWPIASATLSRYSRAMMCTFPHVLFPVYVRLQGHMHMKMYRMIEISLNTCASGLLHSNAPIANALTTEFKPATYNGAFLCVHPFGLYI